MRDGLIQMDLQLFGLMESRIVDEERENGHFRGDGPNFVEQLSFMIHEERLRIQQMDGTVRTHNARVLAFLQAAQPIGFLIFSK